MTGYHKCPLGEIVYIKTGKLDSNFAVEGGKYPFFTCSPNTLSIDTYAFDEEAILLAGNNAEGKFTVKYYDGKFNAYQRTYVITPKDKQIVDCKYLSYVMRVCLAEMRQLSVGTSTRFLTRKILDCFEISLPPLPVQKKIAAILSSLDDKIELNTRMNNVLEEIARALFHRWFVEFEFPNAEGKPYKSAGGKMVESEMGSVPEGWRVGTIGEIADVIDCLHSKKPDRCEEGKPLLQLNNIRDDGLLDMSDIFFISESDYAKWISRCEASQGDCVITNVGRVGAIAQIPEGVKAALGRNMTCVRCKATLPYPTFLLECLLSDTMRLEIINKTDSGTILDSLNVRSIPKLRIVLPDRPTIEAFERIARPIRYNMELNMRENLSLVSSRDVLLPKLMSGELEV